MYRNEFLAEFEILLVLDISSFRAGELASLAGIILLPLLLRSDTLLEDEDENEFLTWEVRSKDWTKEQA